MSQLRNLLKHAAATGERPTQAELAELAFTGVDAKRSLEKAFDDILASRSVGKFGEAGQLAFDASRSLADDVTEKPKADPTDSLSPAELAARIPRF